MEHIIPETISKHRKGKNVIRSAQNAFTKGKSHLNNFISFDNEITGW